MQQTTDRALTIEIKTKIQKNKEVVNTRTASLLRNTVVFVDWIKPQLAKLDRMIRKGFNMDK